MTMKHLLVLSLAFVAVSCASDFTKHFTGSLLVRFGILGDYFLKLPVTIPEALQEGWEQTPRPPGPMPSLVMYCHETKLVCVLYDDTENAAGMQVAFPVNDFKSPIHDMEVTGFSKWTPIPNQETYWAIQQYFVNEEYLALSAEERNANRDSEKLLQLDGVWLTGINKEITKVANDYDVFIEDPTFTKQACIPLMGRHFYHNMTKSLECNAKTMYPWFPIMHSANLVATGLVVFGQFAENKVKDFFERPPKAAVQLIVPDGPQCLYDLAEKPGLVTMHIYYISNPYSLTCILQ